jgi:hypothetical protein
LRRVVQRKEPQRAESVDPPINRVARGGVDPIPLSSSLRRFRFHFRLFPVAVALLKSCDRLAPERTPVQPLAPASHVLAPPLCAALLLRMRVETLCNIMFLTYLRSLVFPLVLMLQI